MVSLGFYVAQGVGVGLTLTALGASILQLLVSRQLMRQCERYARKCCVPRVCCGPIGYFKSSSSELQLICVAGSTEMNVYCGLWEFA